MNYTLALRELELRSPCGYYSEERILKVHLLINIDVTLPIDEATSDFVDYTILATAVKDVCSKEHRLIEDLARNILAHIRTIAHQATYIKIEIKKQNPAMVAGLGYFSIAIEERFD